MRRLLLTMFLAFPLVANSAGAEGWSEISRVDQPSGNLTFGLPWSPARGAVLRIATTNATGAIAIELNRKTQRVRGEPAGAIAAMMIDAAEFNRNALPSNDLQRVEVAVKIRPDFWSLYLADRLVMSMPAPFQPPAVVAVRSVDGGGIKPEDVRFQKVEDFLFHDDFLVPEEQESELTGWESLAGSWRLHSVLEEVDPAIIKRAKPQANAKPRPPRKPMPGMSPNFYSLQGTGTNALLLSGYEFYDAYSLEAAVQVGTGEGGLVFASSEAGGFHAFTVKAREDSDTVRLTLWRTPSSTGEPRVELAAATSEILSGEWVMLRARMFRNRIQCFVDKTLVIDVPADLPVGGRFGLLANTDGHLLFDDVTAQSDHELDFPTVGDLRRHALFENGRFFPRASLLSRGSLEGPPVLEPSRSSRPQWLVMGSPVDGPHVFAADFEAAAPVAEFGLLTGYTGGDRPCWRFVCRRSGTNESFRLESYGTNGATVVRRLSLPAKPQADGGPARVRLMCDTTSGTTLRFYRGDDLVLVHAAPAPVGGASGLYVGPGTTVRITKPDYRFERTDLYTDQFEKNTVFATDPFMRHWSSPEGQWEDVVDGAAWYKGDVFGRVAVHLPLVDRTKIHLGVPEGRTVGTWVVSVSNQCVSLLGGEGAPSTQAAASVPTNLVTGFVGSDSNRVAGYAIHAEGYWLWLTSGDRMLFQHALSAPLKGRRIRIEGFTTAQLASSRVERYNVKDFLFKESLHEWTINGGCWEVINRFRCDPRWSHMNGESSNTLAAIWSKYSFRGDFCVEMYAGTRMGWYDRCGDYNLTVLNSGTSPSLGYTVTCSGWDYDLSQLYTKLFRNGVLLTQSDAYCAPRSRAGNKRKDRSALISTGRDVHGAWYYIKFRRVGKRLEYYFDNDLVFTCEDPDPLAGGSLGVWTFMNSMMVARVKMAAEAIEPRALAFAPSGVEVAPMPEPVPPAPPNAVLANGVPLDGMRPAYWEAADPVSRARLAWHEATNARPYFTMTSVLGSGSMEARCDYPPVPFARVAGWAFEAKRTPRGVFNFHYSVGRLNSAGVYEPKQRYVHSISGEDFAADVCRLSGKTEIPGTPSTGEHWAASGKWVPVRVWLPTEGYQDAGSDTGLLVKVEGFGNLAPGYALQGLTGNGPGEGYAIRDFAPILAARPTLSLSRNAERPSAVTLLGPDGESRLAGPVPWGAVSSNLVALGRSGLVKVFVDARWPAGGSRLPLLWSASPAENVLTCGWSQTQADTIEIRSDGGYPDRELARAKLSIGGKSVPVRMTDQGCLTAIVPHADGDDGFGKQFVVALVRRTLTNRFQMAWADAPVRAPPVLARLDGLLPVFQNFESDDSTLPSPERMRIERFDPDQGSYLTVFNTTLGQRLNADFGKPFSLTRYPLLRFRYKAGPMSRVSLALSDSTIIQLSEDLNSSRPVRGSGGLILDGGWHTWQGQISDALVSQSFHPGMLTATRLRFGSLDRIDQTGKHSELSLDDLAVGPAISRREQLAFTPHYFDHEGITRVKLALRSGVEDFQALSRAQRDVLAWHEIRNHEECTPPIEKLPDGPGHLLLKAVSVRGRESQVTDIPFLLDRQPPVLTCLFEPTENPFSNGSCLRVKVAPDSGAPLDVDEMQLKWNDTVVPLTNSLGSTLGALSESEGLVLNWPLIFRSQLDRTASNEAFKIVLSRLRDGAGNVAADTEVLRRIDYTRDRMPPTLLHVRYPSNILWAAAWELSTDTRPLFAFTEGATATVVRKAGEAPYLAMKSSSATGVMSYTFSPKWKVQSYPYLSFRLRRPIVPGDDTARLELMLETDSTNQFVIGLTPEGRGTTNRLELPQPVPWKANVWVSFTLDVHALLKNQLPPDALRRVVIKRIHLRLTDVASRLQLNAQSFFVYAPWRTGQRVAVDAYDESGLGGIKWEPVPSRSGVLVEWEGMPGPGQGWGALHVRDKAGNVSSPLYVPVYGRTSGPANEAVGVVNGEEG